MLVCDPEGQLRMEAFFSTDLQATPAPILAWVVMRWSVEVTFQEGRAHLGVETQRQWSDHAIACTTPGLPYRHEMEKRFDTWQDITRLPTAA